MLLVTSRVVTPTSCARVRSTSTLNTGACARLLDARVGDAGDRADLRQQRVRVVEVRVEVRAADLQVDRRRRAEVEDLADDVGRRERERDAGKSRGSSSRSFLT